MDSYVEQAFQIVPGIPLQGGNETSIPIRRMQVHIIDPPNSPHIERA